MVENNLKTYRPQKNLFHLVEFYYEFNVTIAATSFLPKKILPCGHTNFLFSWGGYWQMDTNLVKHHLPSCYITGQSDKSYSIGAGLYRLSLFAGFVKYNMPYGTNYENPVLTDE